MPVGPVLGLAGTFLLFADDARFRRRRDRKKTISLLPHLPGCDKAVEPALYGGLRETFFSYIHHF